MVENPGGFYKFKDTPPYKNFLIEKTGHVRVQEHLSYPSSCAPMSLPSTFLFLHTSR